MPSVMFAGHIPAAGRIELIDVPEPEWPPPDGFGPAVLFRPEVACLCGSDLPYFDQSETRYPPGVGHSLHEMVGTVLATTGTRFRPGDRVLVHGLPEHLAPGASMRFEARATVIRAGWLERAWTEASAILELTELYHCGFEPKEAP